MYTDISARFAELGRVPFSARRWFLRYADRILYGTDVAPDSAVYRNTYRLLETEDEYFPVLTGRRHRPHRGGGDIYGLYLPDDVLKKVYYDNAARLLGL